MDSWQAEEVTAHLTALLHTLEDRSREVYLRKAHLEGRAEALADMQILISRTLDELKREDTQ